MTKGFSRTFGEFPHMAPVMINAKLHALGSVRRYVRRCFQAVRQHSKNSLGADNGYSEKIHSPCHIGTVFTHGKYCGIAHPCFFLSTIVHRPIQIRKHFCRGFILTHCQNRYVIGQYSVRRNGNIRFSCTLDAEDIDAELSPFQRRVAY